LRRTLARSLARLGLRLRRPAIDLVASPAYATHVPGRLHDPMRAARILAALREAGLLDPRRLHRPAPAALWQLRLVHDDPYLEGLERPGALERAFGFRMGDRAEQNLLEAQRAMSGGTVLAARLALASRGLAANLGGGFHHARRDRAAGFCLYNDVAVAIATLRHDRRAPRALVVDLDLHDGDGTRAIFADDAEVHTLSIHGRPWDEAPAIESTDVALGAGFGDRELLDALTATLPPLLDRFRPTLAFYLAGADVAADDALGDARLTASGLLERDLFVVRELARRGIPAVALLAGGYGDDAWRYGARFLATRLAGRRIEPPTTAALLVGRYRDLALGLSPEALAGRPAEEPLLTPEDLPGSAALAAETRMLGFYTRAGLELALERLGYVDRLRALGFARPTVELQTSSAAGSTMRVFGDADRRELLVELRLRRDRATLPGIELLRVEWLLLQNPRAVFTAERPALPGQQHPGLGMLGETVAALVLVCDRLKLDGIVVVASRFSTAALATGEMRALDPEAHGRLRALMAALADRPLAEAADAAEGRGVIDEATGEPTVWSPVTMLYPVSARLAERLGSGEWAARAEAARRAARYRVPAPAGTASARA
jgi:acetoin utilization deacetylase AcuC-like enzyme